MYDFVVIDPRTAFVKLITKPIFEARIDARKLVLEQFRNRDKSDFFHSCRVYTYFKPGL